MQIRIFAGLAGTALLASALAFVPTPARADVAVEAGGAFNDTVSGQAALSVGLFDVPLAPVSTELTFAAPFNGGYAATVDARIHALSTTIGAGVGVGSLGAPHRTGVLFNALAAQTIAPRTALEARVYFGSAHPTTVFAGLRFSL